MFRKMVWATRNFHILSLYSGWLVFKKTVVDALLHWATNVWLWICSVFTSVPTQYLYLQGLSFWLACEKWFPLEEIVCAHVPRPQVISQDSKWRRVITPGKHKYLVLEKDIFSDYHSKKGEKKEFENTLSSVKHFYLFSFQRSEIFMNISSHL